MGFLDFPTSGSTFRVPNPTPRFRRYKMYTVGHSRILSVGTYTPNNTVTSREIMDEIDSRNRFELHPEWLERTTGIRTRYVCDSEVAPSDMGTAAAREALDHAQKTPAEIDAIIYAGMTRDRIEPSTAHHIQH